jgi:hypothetical protein
MESMFKVMAEDPDRETPGRLLLAWQSSFGKAAAMVRDAVDRATEFCGGHGVPREVLRDIADERGEINRRKVGWRIKRHADRIVDGLRFVRTPGSRSAEVWKAESVPSVPLVVSTPNRKKCQR